MARTLDLVAAVAEDTARWINSGERPGFDIPAHLAHATQIARDRNFQDMFIVDIDAHHNELHLWEEMVPYIEDPVIRHRALDGGSLTENTVLNQATMSRGPMVAGRIRLSRQIRRDRHNADIRDDILQVRQNMEAMGIDQQIIFPTQFLLMGVQPDQEVEVALSWAYCRWLTENITPHDSHLKSMLYLPISNPEASLRAIEQFGDKPGVVGFMITAPHYMAMHDNRLMKVYAALEERGLPLSFHANYQAWERLQEGMNKFISVHSLGFMLYSMVHLTNLVMNGIPERFPKLKLMFIENGLAWIPFLMQRLDHEYSMRTSEFPLLQKKPSEYMRENISYASQPLEMDNLEALELTMEMMNAETQLMYSSDYPHWDWNLPHSIYDLPFLSDRAKRRILGQNAAEFFNLDRN
jgi:uncharacterized protein